MRNRYVLSTLFNYWQKMHQTQTFFPEINRMDLSFRAPHPTKCTAPGLFNTKPNIPLVKLDIDANGENVVSRHT
jgi:hypothetical protein